MLIYGLAFSSTPRAKAKEGVAPGSNTAVAAQLQHSNRENLRLEREIQDMKRAQRNDAARLVPPLGESPHAPASSLSLSLPAQSALTSMGSSKQLKNLFHYELMEDVYLRDGKAQEATAVGTRWCGYCICLLTRVLFPNCFTVCGSLDRCS